MPKKKLIDAHRLRYLTFFISLLFLGMLFSIGCDDDRFRSRIKHKKVPDARQRLRPAAPFQLPRRVAHVPTGAHSQKAHSTSKPVLRAPLGKRLATTTRPTSRPVGLLPSFRPKPVPSPSLSAKISKKPPKGLKLAPRWSHKEPIRAMAIAPSGLFALTASEDHRVIYWELPRLRRRRTFLFDAPIHHLAISPTGRRFAVATASKKLIILSIEGKILSSQTLSSPIFSMKFTLYDNRLLTTDKRGILTFYNASTLEVLKAVKGCPKELNARTLALDAGQNYTAVICGGDKLWIAPYSGKKNSLAMMPLAIDDVAFLPNSDRLITVSPKAYLTLWRFRPHPFHLKKLTQVIGHVRDISALAYSSDGRYLVTGSWDRHLAIWKVKSSQLSLLRLLSHKGKVTSIAFLPESHKFLATDESGFIALWDIKGHSLHSVYPPPLRAMSLSFNPKRPHLASSAEKGAVAVWDLAQAAQEISMALQPNYIFHVQYALDGNHLISVDPDNVVFWDVNKRRAIDVVRPVEKYALISAAVLGRDWTEVFYGTPHHGVQLWTIRGGPTKLYLHRQPKKVTAVDLHPLSRRAIAATFQGEIFLYDVRRFRLLKSLKPLKTPIRMVHFSPKGDRVFLISDRELYLYSVPELKLLKTYYGSARLYAAAFSKSGEQLAIAHQEQKVLLWNLKSNKVIRTFAGCRSSVRAVQFSPDQRLLAAMCWDGEVKLWNAQKAEELVTFVAFEKKHWLAYTPESFFYASGQAFRYYHLNVGKQLFSLSAFDYRFFSPAKVRQKLKRFIKRR